MSESQDLKNRLTQTAQQLKELYDSLDPLYPQHRKAGNDHILRYLSRAQDELQYCRRALQELVATLE